jgi:hypothetical protein
MAFTFDRFLFFKNQLFFDFDLFENLTDILQKQLDFSGAEFKAVRVGLEEQINQDALFVELCIHSVSFQSCCAGNDEGEEAFPIRVHVMFVWLGNLTSELPIAVGGAKGWAKGLLSVVVGHGCGPPKFRALGANSLHMRKKRLGFLLPHAFQAATASGGQPLRDMFNAWAGTDAATAALLPVLLAPGLVVLPAAGVICAVGRRSAPLANHGRVIRIDLSPPSVFGAAIPDRSIVPILLSAERVITFWTVMVPSALICLMVRTMGASGCGGCLVRRPLSRERLALGRRCLLLMGLRLIDLPPKKWTGC